MPTLIDELVLKISMDASTLQKQGTAANKTISTIRENAETTGKRMADAGTKMGEMFARAKIEAISLMAVIGGGAGLLTALVKSADGLAGFGRAAQNLNNMDPSRLDAWGQALKRIGGTAQDVYQSFDAIAKVLAQRQLGIISPATNFLQALPGVQANSTPEQVAMAFSRWMRTGAGSKMTPEEQNVWGAQIGLTQPMINELRRNVDADLAESVRLGLRTKDMIDTATKFQASFAKLEQATDHLTEKFEAFVEGPIGQFIDRITEFELAHPDLSTGLGVGGAAVGGLAGSSVIARLLGLTGLADAFGALTGIVIKLTGWLGLLTGLTGDTPDTPQPTETWPGRVTNWVRRQFGLPPIVRNAGTPGPATVAANMNLSADERALLDAIAGGEQNANGYASKNPKSSAYGRYQFIDATRNRLLTDMGLPLDTPLTDELQDRMALRLAVEAGWKPWMSPEQSAAILNKVWPSLPGGSQQNTTMAQFIARLRHAQQVEAQRAQRAPAPKPAGPRATPPPQTIPSWLPDWYRSMWQNQYPQTSSMNTSDNSVTIGDINIHTAATSANAIAKEIHGAISNQLVSAADRGLA